MIEYGFFDSNNHDRVYNSKNFSDYFEGLIHDGVYAYVGDKFKVSPGEDMSVIVGTGRAKILNRYVKSTTLLPIDIQAADTLYPRIDAIVIGVDVNERIGAIESIQGIPGENPQNPKIPSDENVLYYVLAYIRIDANASRISFENIRDMRGTVECPWVAGIIEPIDLGGIADQYRAMIDKFEEESREIIEKLQANKEIINNLENNLAEIIDSRTSSISGETFNTLNERLESDFSYLKKAMRAVDVISKYIQIRFENGDIGNVDAVLYANDTLSITGNGSINDLAFEKREDFTVAEIDIGGDAGIGAFSGCTNLGIVTVSCNKICDKAFAGCFKLNTFTIGKSVTEIGSQILLGSGFHIANGIEVLYEGTISEWNAVTKAENWVGEMVTVKDGVVVCLDGTAEV